MHSVPQAVRDKVRRYAARKYPAWAVMLHFLRGCGKHLVPALIELLSDPEPRLRRNAASALGTLRCVRAPRLELRSAVAPLAAALVDDDPWVRFEAAYALRGIEGESGPGTEAAVEALDSPDVRLRLRAVKFLTGTGFHSVVVIQALVSALQDPSRKVRYLAADALGQRGMQAKVAVAILSTWLQPHQPSSAQVTAAAALAQIEPSLRPTLRRVMVSVLAKGRTYARRKAACALADLGLLAAPAFDALVQALDDADTWVVVYAVTALGRLGPPAAPAAARLAALLGRPDPSATGIHADIVEALGAMGPAARAVLPELEKVLALGIDLEVTNAEGADEEQDVAEVMERLLKLQAAQAIGHISGEPETALTVAVQLLRNPDGLLRCQAAAVLAEIGPAAATAVPALRQALRDANRRVRQEARDALGKILNRP